MSKHHLTTLSDGKLRIISLREHQPAEEDRLLAKTLFELSRDPDNMEEHFDPKVHTLATLAAGIPGHCVAACRECDTVDLPAEQERRKLGKMSLRDAWVDTGTAIEVDLAKAQAIHVRNFNSTQVDELVKLEGERRQTIDAVVLDRITKDKATVEAAVCPTNLGACHNADEIKAIWPPELPWPY
jgi:hypothetical protein